MDVELAAPRETEQTAVTPYSYYVLAVLFLTMVVSNIDRRVLVVLQESIRHDLGLNDAELGLLTGLAFSIFYATFSVPIAWLADRSSRRNIISVCIALWSAMTALCGMAQSFTQLLLARIGVAVGEGGCNPAAHAMISEYFSHGQRAFALAIYSTGFTVGAFIGLAGGGWLNDAFDWHTAFIVVGLPGVALAVLVHFTIREPERTKMIGPTGISGAGIAETVRRLWGIRSFRMLTIAATLSQFTSAGIGDWNAPFLIRSYGMTAKEAGLALGLIVGIAGGLGILFGGYFCDRLGRRDLRWYGWLPAITTGLAVPFSLAAYVSPTAALSLAFIALPSFLTVAVMGPLFGTVQTLAPPHMRASAAAVLLFLVNAVGHGAGPTVVGVFSELLKPHVADASLRLALTAVVLVKGFAALHFWMAAKSLAGDLTVAGAAHGRLEYGQGTR